MNKYWSFLLFIIVFLVFVSIYHAWFSLNLISSGDYWPFFKSMYASRSLPLPAWDFNHVYGMGGFSGPFLWIHANLTTPITFFGSMLGLPWVVVERLGHMYPFLVLSFLSPFLLSRYIFKSNRLALFSSVLFGLNTYSLMIAGGGQFAGVGMGYVLMPLVILYFLKICDGEKVFLNSLISGLIFGIQFVFDIRFGYMTAIVLFVLALFNLKKVFTSKVLPYLILSGVVTLFLNVFWVVPSLIVRQNPFDVLGAEYSSAEAVRFFSFAKLENTIALLHPNWPHNIFGKVSFMKPEFLLVPVLAFISVFFVSKSKKYISFFLLIGFLGIFLAKGANAPLGFVYTFLFETILGFQLFRDPTKWYSLIALSYSILIPFSVSRVYELVKDKKEYNFFGMMHSDKNKILNLQNLFIFSVLVYLVLLSRQAITGELTGAFSKTSIPPDYIRFEKQTERDEKFYRTLWIPSYQRYSYYSQNHPSIQSVGFLRAKDAADVVEKLQEREVQELIGKSSVRYIIVPIDSEREIFLTEREYDNGKRLHVIKALEGTPWLTKIAGYEELAVFENKGFVDHFWSMGGQTSISSKQISPTKYKISVTNGIKNDRIVFSETFDSNWSARYSSAKIVSERYERFNSFILPNDGSYDMVVSYEPQKIVDMASIFSISTFFLTGFVVMYSILSAKKEV